MLKLLPILALSALIPLAAAHMQMLYPLPFRSPFDSSNILDSEKDYDNQAPLNLDGSNFPCKGYQASANNSNANIIKAAWTAGDTYNMSITGGANHGGGSCQLSLSYDNGQSFRVIKSMIGGCPITTDYNFTIPAYAPASSSVLFAWSWLSHNTLEMYMNCARVSINPTPMTSVRQKLRGRRAFFTALQSIDDLPALYTCNIGPDCSRIPETDVQFPDPGADVVYGNDNGGASPSSGTTTSASYTTSNLALVTGNSTNATYTLPALTTLGTATTSATLLSSSTATLTFNSILTSTMPMLTTTTSFPTRVITSFVFNLTSSVTVVSTTTLSTTSIQPTTPSTSTTSSTSAYLSSTTPVTGTPILVTALSSLMYNTPSTSSTFNTPLSSLIPNNTTSISSTPSATPSLPSGPCISGTFTCNSPKTFSQCISGDGYTFMGSVAAGMQCVEGSIIRLNDGSCTPSGALFCNGTLAFYLCDEGGLINMGNVAAGTSCVDGVIQRV